MSDTIRLLRRSVTTAVNSLGPVRDLRSDRDRHAAHARELEHALHDRVEGPVVAPWVVAHLAASIGLAHRDSPAQVERLAQLAVLASDLPWDDEPATGLAYWGTTTRGDAALLSALLRERRPPRIVVVRIDAEDPWTVPAALNVAERWDWSAEIVEVLVDGVAPAVENARHVDVDGAQVAGTLLELVRAGDALLLGRVPDAESAVPLLTIAATVISRLPSAVLVQVPTPRDLPLAGAQGLDGWLAPGTLVGPSVDAAVRAFPELGAGAPTTAWLVTGTLLTPTTTPVPGRTEAVDPAAVERLIEWTGERCVPWTDDHQVIYEHQHRYLYAAAVLAAAGGPRTILDLASGEGYGAALLAAHGHTVTGIDIAADAVAHARASYADVPGLAFSTGSMTDLSAFADGSVGAITCFEAIEHIEEHEDLLGEISRVLGDDGILVISSPDIDVYTHEQGQDNPFHVHELDRSEFHSLLAGHFDHVRTWGQTVLAGSFIADLDVEERADLPGPSLVQAIRPDEPTAPQTWSEIPVPRATYLVAVASRSPLPDLPGLAVLLDSELTIVRHAHRLLAQR